MRMVPAPGQAAIAIQVRKQEKEKFGVLDHLATSRAVRLERWILDRLGWRLSGCLGCACVGNDDLFFFPRGPAVLKVSKLEKNP